jgi:hypothetical protein
MNKLIAAFGLISLMSTVALAGSLDSFVGTYVLQQGTQGTNANGDLICPSPLILTLSVGALDSNMPQLPLLQVITSDQDNVHYTGFISADGNTFSYKVVTKTSCEFFGLFCASTTTEGTLQLEQNALVLNHSESTSSQNLSSSGTCSYSK